MCRLFTTLPNYPLYLRMAQPEASISPMIKAVFFDVGYTLLHTTAHTADMCARVLREAGQARDPDQIRAAMRVADQRHEAHYHALHDDWARPHTIEALWLGYYAGLFDQLGVNDREGALARKLIAWYGSPGAWQPFDDVVATLDALRERGLQRGAVSDWGPSLTGILHAHGLSRHLDWVLASGNIGLCKPDAQFYNLALQRAGVEPHEAIHVGDSYYGDVRGARSVGITPVLLDRKRRAPPVDCTKIHALHELLALV